MRARYIQEMGTLGRLRIYWDNVVLESVEPCEQCPNGHPRMKYSDSCPNAMGRGGTGVHNAFAEIGRLGGPYKSDAFGREENYAAERWPTRCSDCGAPVPASAAEPTVVGATGVRLVRQVFVDRLYDTASGRPEPGDVFETRSHLDYPCPYWDNCGGVHWHGILPNGHEWDMDSRASNCTMREDRTHRCWVRTGAADAGTLSVGKAGGPTCSAGGGSIAAPGWHGFLTNFSWVG